MFSLTGRGEVMCSTSAGDGTSFVPMAREDQRVMDFLREHSTILLTLFTILFPVVVGLGGTWLGSHIQAKGGLAQAKAAKEAAETAAAATLQAVREQSDRTAAASHAAAVRDRRTAAIADLLRAVRELVRALDRLYIHPDTGSMNGLYEAFVHARGPVELCAPTTLIPATERLAATTRNLSDLARDRSEAHRARARLVTLQHELPDLTAMMGVTEALRAFRVAACAEAFDTMTLHDAAIEALRQFPSITSDEAAAILLDCWQEELRPLRDRLREEHQEAMNDFIEQARAILGVND
ncbi:hypothetical protein ACFYRL_35610 [Streptomyces goshikiensis]|uniref:hypothetical protein n=1 Tax=Streptomyces goshikiensis TaxID=1942 RepID=UPI0036B69B56